MAPALLLEGNVNVNLDNETGLDLGVLDTFAWQLTKPARRGRCRPGMSVLCCSQLAPDLTADLWRQAGSSSGHPKAALPVSESKNEGFRCCD